MSETTTQPTEPAEVVEVPPEEVPPEHREDEEPLPGGGTRLIENPDKPAEERASQDMPPAPMPPEPPTTDAPSSSAW